MTIAAPAATATDPLTLVFVLDGTLLPGGSDPAEVAVLRNGVLVDDCAGPAGHAAPDPCVESRDPATGDDFAITVLTSLASTWTLAVAPAPPCTVDGIAEGEPCADDGNLCTADRCGPAGECVHAPEIATACRKPQPGKAVLSLKAHADPRRNAIGWSWTRGAATTKSDFGSPLSSTSYALCIFEEPGGLDSASLRLAARAPAGGTCPTKPCWKETRSGFVRSDRTRSPDGLATVRLVAGADGKSRITVRGRGAMLPTSPPLSLAPPVAVQLRSSAGECWDATFSSPSRSDASQFRSRSD